MGDSAKSKDQLLQELRKLEEELALARAQAETHRATEAALRESEEKYRSLVENATEGVYQTSADGKIVAANPALVKMLGYDSEDELRAVNVAEDLYVSPPVRSQFARDLKEAGELREMELELKRKDGEQITVLDSARVSLDDQGEVLGFWGVLTDISSRKRSEEERRRLDSRVRDAQKLESLSVLAGGVAHDFNNLLMGVLGNAELALVDLPLASPVRDSVEKIRAAALRAADLARQMLAYSGRGSFVVGNVDLSNVVSEMQQLLRSSSSPDTLIEYHLSQGMQAVPADVTQVRQVVLNLVSNACEALGESGGIVDVSTGMMDADDKSLSQAIIGEGCAEGAYAFIEVVDTGVGMDQETVSKMFDPFFTTKFTGRGLGLAAVSGIVRGHGGAIIVSSSIHKGTAIRVLFPTSRDTKRRQSDAFPEIDPDTGAGKVVLLVDDDPSVLDVGSRILKRAGFRVITATDGHDALHAFRERSTDVDCVLLDLTMPGMGGEDAFEELRKLSESVPVILGSGYFHSDLRTQFEDRGFAAVLHNPYMLDHLIVPVARVVKSRDKKSTS